LEQKIASGSRYFGRIKNNGIMTELSIIIVNWNTRELLRACLNSIYHFCSAINFEVIVVDNHSSDQSQLMVKQEFPMVQLIESGENFGFARANNLALQKASGQYILFLNPDTIFIDDSLHDLLNFYKGKQDAGFLGCLLLNQDHTFQQSCFALPGLIGHTLANTGLYIFLPRILRQKIAYRISDFNSIMKVDWMRGAFMLISRNKLDRTGYFDDTIFMYGEDLDICLRCQKQGYHNYFFPLTTIVHYGNQSGQIRFGEQRLFTIFQSQHYVYQKHFGATFTACHELITSVTAWIKSFQHWIKSVYLSGDKRKYEREKCGYYNDVANLAWQFVFKSSAKSNR